MNTFREELEALLNKYSLESGSNTPDFILARYLESCIRVLDRATNQRERWYGREKEVSDLMEEE